MVQKLVLLVGAGLTLLIIPYFVRTLVGLDAGTVGGNRLDFTDVTLACPLRNLVGPEAGTMGRGRLDFTDVRGIVCVAYFFVKSDLRVKTIVCRDYLKPRIR